MTLTDEQQQAVENGEAVESTVNGVPCVVLRKDAYDQVRMVFDAPTTEEMADILEQTWGDDPALDAYQDFKQA